MREPSMLLYGGVTSKCMRKWRSVKKENRLARCKNAAERNGRNKNSKELFFNIESQKSGSRRIDSDADEFLSTS